MVSQRTTLRMGIGVALLILLASLAAQPYVADGGVVETGGRATTPDPGPTHVPHAWGRLVSIVGAAHDATMFFEGTDGAVRRVRVRFRPPNEHVLVVRTK